MRYFSFLDHFQFLSVTVSVSWINTNPLEQGFPTWGSRGLRKGGRQGKCKNKNKFIFNMGRENRHKIPLIMGQISK